MPEVSLPFVVLMGIGTVFFGLICIIFLSMAMSAICRSMGGAPVPAPAVPSPVMTCVITVILHCYRGAWNVTL